MNMTSQSKGVAIVTGAAQGIGRCIALRLAGDGYDVAINDLPRSKEKIEILAQEIQQTHGRKTCLVLGDVSVESDVKAMVARTVEKLGRLDVMIANAGINKINPIASFSTEDWNRTIATNLNGTFFCYKYAAQQMIAQGNGGRIIGASSSAGKQGYPQLSAYCASKFAIRGLTQSVAMDLGPHNITVNTYCPGAIDTEFMRGPANEYAAIVELEAKKTVFGHIGSVDDVASLVSYLVSPESQFITGQSISVNGGCYFD